MADFTDIDLGSIANDDTGTDLRAAGDKINDNNALLKAGDKNVSTTQKVIQLSKSLLTGIVDDTYFDLMSFDIASVSSSNSYGMITGKLVINVLSRNTGGSSASQHLYYRVSIVRGTAGVLQLTLTLEGTDDTGSVTLITSTLQEKTGATNQNMILEFKFTNTGFDTDSARIYATFEGQSFATTAVQLPVATFLI